MTFIMTQRRPAVAQRSLPACFGWDVRRVWIGALSLLSLVSAFSILGYPVLYFPSKIQNKSVCDRTAGMWFTLRSKYKWLIFKVEPHTTTSPHADSHSGNTVHTGPFYILTITNQLYFLYLKTFFHFILLGLYNKCSVKRGGIQGQTLMCKTDVWHTEFGGKYWGIL